MRTAILHLCKCLAFLCWALPGSAQTIYFNFGANPANDPSGRVWNGVGAAVAHSNTGSLTGIADENGNITTVSLQMVRRFNGLNTNGTQLSTVFPPGVTRDSHFGNTEAFGIGPNIFPAFRLTGLSAGVPHSLKFYASRTSVSDVRETAYTVTGSAAQTVYLDAANNLDNTVAANGVQPDANGEILVEIAPGPNNTNGNHFTYLGAMIVESIPTQQPVVFTTEPQDLTVLQTRSATFISAVNSTPPYTIQWLLNGTPIDGANSFTYTIPSAEVNMDGGLYSVRVSNLNFTATSRQARLTVTPDTAGPLLTSATSAGPWAVDLVFSEPLAEQTALDFNSWQLNGGLNTVVNVVLSPDRLRVTVTPGEPLPAASTLVISGVTDAAGNLFTQAGPLNLTIPQPDGLSVLVDFGDQATQTTAAGAPDDPLNTWNNVTATTGSAAGNMLQPLVRNDGTSSELTLTITSRFNGSNTNGTLEPAPYATDGTRDSLFGNTELFNTLENVTPAFRISGLVPGQPCDLVFYASRTGVNDNRETVYTVTGGTTASASLNVSNNVTGTAVVNGVSADGNGELLVTLSPGPNNNNANHFTYLGVLKVTPRPYTGPPFLFTPTIADGIITLRWAGNGVLETTENPAGTWVPVNPVPSSPYSDAVGPAKRFYRLRYPTAP